MAEGKKIIRPILKFLREAKPQSITGGGKTEKNIVKSRLSEQRKFLTDTFMHFFEEKPPAIAGRSQLIVEMFEDSSASSWTPTDIFNEKDGCEVVYPAFDGYIVEAEESAFPRIAKKIQSTNNVKDKVDISRVKAVKAFTEVEVLRGGELEEIWNNAKRDKQFHMWLLPYRSYEARELVADKVQGFFATGIVSLGDQKFNNPFKREGGDIELHTLKRVLGKYVREGVASLSLKISNREAFRSLVSSGAIYRIEAASPLETNQAPPGDGEEPCPENYNSQNLPSVVVVDGGHSAQSYNILKSMCMPALIDDEDADQRHGNQVISLVCHGHAWNNNLKLPELNCKFIPAQAIAKRGVPSQPTDDQFISYLRELAQESKEYSSVWNLSFNTASPIDADDEVSYLGHEISKIAREFDILPVISIGNVSVGNQRNKLCPPADW